MKVITQEEFDNFPILDKYKQCPLTDSEMVLVTVMV